jgi:hypothetical protein
VVEGRWILGATALLVVGAAAAGNSLRVAMGVWVIAIAWLAVGAVHSATRRAD